MKKRRLYFALAAGVGLYLLLRRKPAAAPPAVAGTLTVGGASLIIDDNVLSPTFGYPIQQPN